MARFVLIHGAWQGAWSWCEVEPVLSALGHEVVAIDLPGHGDDRSPLNSITLDDYLACTAAALQSQPDKSILVGHSMAGTIARQVAGSVQHAIAAYVSVAALLPSQGTDMLSLFSDFDPEYMAQIQWSPDRRSACLSPEGVRSFFLTECTEATVQSVLPRLTAEPVVPFETPVYFADTPVPRYYIECLRDRIVPIALQQSMHAGYPEDSVFTLDTGHAPHLSTPSDLARILHQIAGRL